MGSTFDIYVTLVFAGLLILTVGYAARRGKTGLVLMSLGTTILLGVVVYYIATELG